MGEFLNPTPDCIPGMQIKCKIPADTLFPDKCTTEGLQKDPCYITKDQYFYSNEALPQCTQGQITTKCIVPSSGHWRASQ